MDGFRIDRLPDGGFVVGRMQENGQMPLVLACTDLGEALNYLRAKLDPRDGEAVAKAAATEMPPPNPCAKCGSRGMERYCPRPECGQAADYCTTSGASFCDAAVIKCGSCPRRVR